MAITEADRGKAAIKEYLVTFPDGANFSSIMASTGKTSNVLSYLLTALLKEGVVTSPEKGIWRLTEAGMQQVGKRVKLSVEEPGSVMKPDAGQETTEETHVPDAYDKFMQIGRSVGIREDFLKVVTDHMFLGDIYDLNYVWDTLQGMFLRPDVTKRIFNIWSRVIQQPIPPKIASQIMPPGTEAAREASEKLPPKLFTIIGDEIVADPEGEFSFAQARQVLMTKVIQGAAPGLGGDSIAGILGALTPFMEQQRTAKAEDAAKQGEQSVIATVVKSLIEKQGGGQQALTLTDVLTLVEKIDEARKGAVAAVAAGAGKSSSGFEDLERMVNMMDKMKGLFGSREGGNAPLTIAIKGANGETGAVPIDTFFQLQDHQRQMRREDEELDSKKETAKTIRSFLDRISKAAGNIASR